MDCYIKHTQHTQNYQQLNLFARSIKTLVGWFSESRYDTGEPVAMVACCQEFGTDSIPQRPFMRPTAQTNANKWRDMLLQALKYSKDTERAFNMLGLKVAGDIREAITEVTEPPLAPATVKARMRHYVATEEFQSTIAKPLIDTGLMISSVTHKTEVE